MSSLPGFFVYPAIVCYLKAAQKIQLTLKAIIPCFTGSY